MFFSIQLRLNYAAAVKLVHLALLISSLLMTGCMGGASGGNDGIRISGVASAGPLRDAPVFVFSIKDGAKGPLLNTTTTNSKGKYSVAIGAYSGSVLIEVSGAAIYYVDEATGQDVQLKITLRSIRQDITDDAEIAITPLTELAYQFATESLGGLSSSQIELANSIVGSSFDIYDILRGQPSDVLDPESSLDSPVSQKYGIVLAALSKLGSLDLVMGQLKQDFAQNGSVSEAMNGRLELALTNFLFSSLNRTGITDMSQLMGLQSGPVGGPRPVIERPTTANSPRSPAIQLPPNWTVRYSADGYPVYENIVTGERYDFRSQGI